MRSTKLVATLGPASEQKDVMRELIKAGVNVFRFNFSHGSHEEHGGRLQTAKELNIELGTTVGYLLDTKGPEIRTGEFESKSVLIKKGSTVRISMTPVLGNETYFSVSYPGLYDDMKIGDTVRVDDGYLELVVVEKDEEKRELVTLANNTHAVKSRRGINIPNVVLNMPFISEKDREDIIFAAQNEYDYIAASFTRRAEDVIAVREILDAHGGQRVQIICKIENQEGVDNVDSIIEVADGIMVARGDLGTEIPAEEVPVAQKHMIQACQARGKVVIVATQMLESMQKNPRPTRAEVSDIAHVVYDGADATMLSGESAAGDYPLESVSIMAKIQERIEHEVDYERLLENGLKGSYDQNNSRLLSLEALGHSASKIALEFNGSAIFAYGYDVAKQAARFRPACPIVAFVDNYRQARGLALYYGVHPIVRGDFMTAAQLLVTNQIGTAGSLVVVLKDGELTLKTL